MRLPTKTEIASGIVALLLVAWVFWVREYTDQAYLLEGSRIKLIIVALASVIGILAAWRVFRHGNLPGQKKGGPIAAFFIVAGSVGCLFWNVPEAIMVANAHQRVSDKYMFRMVYPGPSCGRHCTCKAGVIYYDTFLQREIEFCHNDDASTFFYTDYMRVDKRISAQGGKILGHEAIH
jgi:hypothetical protein